MSEHAILIASIGVVVASVAVVVTFVGVIWSGILTRKSNEITLGSNTLTMQSNELTEKNLLLQHRPWLLIGEPRINMLWGQKETWNKRAYSEMTLDRWEENVPIKEVNWEIITENNGNTPITNINFHDIGQWDKKITPDMMKQSLPRSTSSILLPHEKSLHSLVIHLHKDLKDKDRPYFVGHMYTYDYTDYNGKITSHVVGKIWSFAVDEWTIHHTWID